MLECELLSLGALRATAPANPGAYRTHAQIESNQTKTTKSGSPFLELKIAAADGSLVLRAWDNTPAFGQAGDFQGGDWVEITGHWHENGSFGLEAKDWKLRRLEPEEIATALLGSPELAEKQARDNATIEDYCARLADPRLRALCLAFLEKFGDRFRRAAAARHNHHARRGGLAEHVAQMMRCAAAICDAYPQLHRDLILAGVLFHDCGKLWENGYPESGFAMPYSDLGEMLGHITIGIEVANSLWHELMQGEEAVDWRELDPPSEQVRLHLLHLIGSHHGQYDFGAPVLPKTPEAIVLHHVDNIDAKLEMLFEGYKTATQLAPNIFERVRPFTHNLVRPLAHGIFESAPDSTPEDRIIPLSNA